MGLTFVRTVILYVSVIAAMRIMGKRTIGEMHPTEMVVAIMISDLATVPMQSKAAPLFDGIVPIFTLVILELVFAFLMMKSRFVRRIMVGCSRHVVRGGQLVYDEMTKLRVTVEDIEEQIRLNGYTSLEEIEEVVVETNGQVSVIAKKSASPVLIKDVDIEGEENVTPHIVIADGRLNAREMRNAKINMRDVEREKRKAGAENVSDILYMSAIEGKIVHIQKKE